MSTRYASGRKSIAECDRCGFRAKLRELRHLIVKGRDTNMKVCNECWEEDHPQLHLGETPVYDPQAVRNPRPDSPGYPESREQIIMLTPQTTSGVSGYVRVAIS